MGQVMQGRMLIDHVGLRAPGCRYPRIEAVGEATKAQTENRLLSWTARSSALLTTLHLDLLKKLLKQLVPEKSFSFGGISASTSRELAQEAKRADYAELAHEGWVSVLIVLVKGSQIAGHYSERLP